MTTQTEALKLALEAFETLTQYNMVRANIFRRFEPTCTGDYVDLREFREKAKPVITAIKEALQSNEQVEPVAWRAWFDADNSAKWLFTLWPEEEHPSFDWQPLYTHPPVPTAQPEQENQREAEVIDRIIAEHGYPKEFQEFAMALKTKEPEQEPVAWMRDDEMKAMVSDEKRAWILCGRSELIEDYNKPLYATPPQRKPLTDEQITALLVELCIPKYRESVSEIFTDVVRAIEAAHGIKE